MFKEDDYEQIFTQRITNQNIEIIKKFFVFQPTNIQGMKPYSSLMSRAKQTNLSAPKKHNPKFPGGFQQWQKSIHQNSNDQQVQSSASITVKCQKAPTNQISSFLQGLTSRITKQSQKKINEQQEGQNLEIISPQKRMNYQQVMSNLNKLKKQNRTKYNSLLPTSNTSNSHSLSNQIEFPLLQKRTISPQKRNTGSTSNTFTPTVNNKSSTPSCISEKQKQIKTDRMSFQGNRAFQISYSSKLMKPIEEPSLPKGYLAYQIHAKAYLERHQQNLLNDPQHKRNLLAVTATNYIIINRNNLKIIAQKKSDEQIQIASLTKIMTCYLSLLVCRKYNVNINDVLVRVSDRAEQMPGTSAQLQAGDLVTLKDLLYGLMLPSGNDASIVIADTVGKIIQKYKKKPSKKTYFDTFLFHMNLLAKQIGIQQNFQNSSGLSYNPNFSSPKAITILTALALKNEIFYQIVNCKQYEIQIRNQRFGLVRKQVWKNTNKLLWKGWQGVKTGTTQSAGHCLMSCKGDFIISVFNCQTLNKRFTQSIKIYEQLMNICQPTTQSSVIN